MNIYMFQILVIALLVMPGISSAAKKKAPIAFHIVEDNLYEVKKLFIRMKRQLPKGIRAEVKTYRRPADAKQALGYDRYFVSADRKKLAQWAAMWESKPLRASAPAKATKPRKQRLPPNIQRLLDKLRRKKSGSSQKPANRAQPRPRRKTRLVKSFYRIVIGSYEVLTTTGKRQRLWRTLLINKRPSIYGRSVIGVGMTRDAANMPLLELRFTRKASDRLEMLTGAHVGNRLVLLKGQKIQLVTMIGALIRSGMMQLAFPHLSRRAADTKVNALKALFQKP